MAILSFQAGEAISAGDVVGVTASGVIRKGIATSQEQASVIGIALDSVSVGNLVRVSNDSVYTYLNSFVSNTVQYLSPTTSGVLIDYAAWQSQLNSLPSSGAFLTRVGRTLSNSAIELEIERPIYITK